jgi:hypothetical protein
VCLLLCAAMYVYCLLESVVGKVDLELTCGRGMTACFEHHLIVLKPWQVGEVYLDLICDRGMAAVTSTA